MGPGTRGAPGAATTRIVLPGARVRCGPWSWAVVRGLGARPSRVGVPAVGGAVDPSAVAGAGEGRGGLAGAPAAAWVSSRTGCGGTERAAGTVGSGPRVRVVVPSARGSADSAVLCARRAP